MFYEVKKKTFLQNREHGKPLLFLPSSNDPALVAWLTLVPASVENFMWNNKNGIIFPLQVKETDFWIELCEFIEETEMLSDNCKQFICLSRLLKRHHFQNTSNQCIISFTEEKLSGPKCQWDVLSAEKRKHGCGASGGGGPFLCARPLQRFLLFPPKVVLIPISLYLTSQGDAASVSLPFLFLWWISCAPWLVSSQDQCILSPIYRIYIYLALNKMSHASFWKPHGLSWMRAVPSLSMTGGISCIETNSHFKRKNANIKCWPVSREQKIMFPKWIMGSSARAAEKMWDSLKCVENGPLVFTILPFISGGGGGYAPEMLNMPRMSIIQLLRARIASWFCSQYLRWGKNGMNCNYFVFFSSVCMW